MQQIWAALNGWTERPFEESVVQVPKYEVPFPSVTICPAGNFHYQEAKI